MAYDPSAWRFDAAPPTPRGPIGPDDDPDFLLDLRRKNQDRDSLGSQPRDRTPVTHTRQRVSQAAVAPICIHAMPAITTLVTRQRDDE